MAQELSQRPDLKPSCSKWIDITPLHPTQVSETASIKYFLLFYNELKFHILSRDGEMFRLSRGIEISIASKMDIVAYLCALNHFIKFERNVYNILYSSYPTTVWKRLQRQYGNVDWIPLCINTHRVVADNFRKMLTVAEGVRQSISDVRCKR